MSGSDGHGRAPDSKSVIGFINAEQIITVRFDIADLRFARGVGRRLINDIFVDLVERAAPNFRITVRI